MAGLFSVCHLRRHFSDENMKHLPRLLTMCPCFACRIPLLESRVNENTCTAESGEKTLCQTFNLHNMDLHYKIVSLNLVSGQEWINRGKVKGSEVK